MEEAALTGESVPVQKNAALVLDKDATLGDRKNTVFMGTVVNYGRGRGIVVSTGMHTQLGLIADMLQAVEDEGTPLQGTPGPVGQNPRHCRAGDLWSGVSVRLCRAAVYLSQGFTARNQPASSWTAS